MTQSNWHTQDPALHVAIIMDGNGRWATRRGRPRALGHRAGARAVRRIVEAAPVAGIGTLTLYAFSADNWSRPEREVGMLMRLFRSYLASETARCVENGVRLRLIGRRDRLPEPLRLAMHAAEDSTRGGERLLLRIALDYSARDAIARAAAAWKEDLVPSREEFARLLDGSDGGCAPNVDLLIRTGGEQRLSDFLLWESAYAELHFSARMWPDFGPADLHAAVADFRTRDRRFGALPRALAG
ncbi:MAG: di-trans,poly-cis-decaprenylcistransferase [Longimicrobiaceae bacterium]